MAGNSGGPWGGGGNNGGGDDEDRNRNDGRKPGNDAGIPEIDELVNKGREQLRVLMGGRGDNGGNRPAGSGGGGEGPEITRGMVALGIFGAAALWLYASAYTVKPEERSIELFLGEFTQIGEPGLNFAPWPIVKYEIVPVTEERRIAIGTSNSGQEAGFMLTGDENIVDVDFQVVWNVDNPADFKFTLEDPEATIRAVAESAMREIIAQSELTPILNTNRGQISEQLEVLIQQTLTDYKSGVNIVRVNLNKTQAPDIAVEVTDLNGVVSMRSPFDAFSEVQNAEQEGERLQNVADAYANRVVAEARGEAAQIVEQAEGYRAEVVNNALGEASRFTAVLEQYQLAPEVTRKRIYLETLEQVIGGVDMILLDENDDGGQGVVPYLPLNEIRRSGGSN
ncbi:FtsH protease activity modulator HflK [Yoonia sp. I 8.24]|uniref:FtsH protease activity modulator HflK n=1 Tax=Yoonia sp. I 8.24 TaxID=1537229 RepID=UPI001EDFD31B|nr:FtsH protease activity modulator HflK [Yoonia sp. I 8.24]MCG3267224.1 FtsH protease activity modulator HflK [Yoonia sp. I 8.24]